jgi:type IV pilus assembly protein PilX
MGMQREKGIVLVVVLVLMLPLTLMAVSMMQWSREQMKMSSATSQHLRWLANTDAAAQSLWLQPELSLQIATLAPGSVVEWITANKAYKLSVQYDTACGRTALASSHNMATRCRYADVSFNELDRPSASPSSVTTVELPLYPSDLSQE